MLEKIPHAVGEAMSGLRAGIEKTAYRAEFENAPETIRLTSPAFADGAAMPARFTQDGEKLSPPLAWSGIPAGTAALVLLVEDADSPTPKPIVHAIAWDLSPTSDGLPAGALASPGADGTVEEVGRNTFLKAGYLPPDPPTGHGPHRYLFQLYALNRHLGLDGHPGRSALLSAMHGHVLAKGVLTGTYERR
ncbi:YbhB/YbcL family Raf kinase inhibitor-like protein [Methylobacterium platani]|uniref:Phosphatidylethanolamine-binding protein n=2 Tax=Methylobacterium platani TaxID=427683 RepID=A0A179S494_9HYPH|nr:YbhB/YbcL family Raf kinase inhibitor-like protein [Methylobacterium platani]KMO20566.1 phosphatidylethanolamine-binding protein [Methylobacterium platani JCM 14648]OAS21009.1 phosphatidylethanolamine-binding protein [Methylobacterium platani]